MAKDCSAETAEIIAVMANPSASYWLKQALATALDRDAFEAERDALVLARLLTQRLDGIVERHFSGPRAQSPEPHCGRYRRAGLPRGPDRFAGCRRPDPG